MIIIIGDIIPAETAASPRINPPSIEMALPVVEDILKSLSLSISKEIIINNASITAGNGTNARWAFSKSKSDIGIASWLYVVTAIYALGKRIAIKKAKILMILINVVLIDFW